MRFYNTEIKILLAKIIYSIETSLWYNSHISDHIAERPHLFCLDPITKAAEQICFSITRFNMIDMF